MRTTENDQAFEVLDGTVHHLPSCPCLECERERERRARVLPTRQRAIISMPVEAAELFGFVSHRSPRGSLARSLLPEQSENSRLL